MFKMLAVFATALVLTISTPLLHVSQATALANDVNGKIAYTKLDPNGSGRTALYTLDPDTNQQQQLTSYGLINGTIKWSPDGTQVAFTDNGSLEIMQADGTARNTVIHRDAMRVGDFEWSPDGLGFLFIGSNDSYLYSANRDGSGIELILDIKVWNLSWSPVAETIVFTGTAPEGGQQIFSIDLQAETYLQLTSGEYNGGPVISPDGTSIVYVGVHQNKFVLSTMNLDGSNQKPLLDSNGQPVYGYVASWAPDSTSIIYAHDDSNTRPNLRKLDAAGNITVLDPVTSWQTASDWQYVTDLRMVYRLANWKTNERLFTTNPDEVFHALTHYEGWVYEDVAMEVYSGSMADSTPVYRLANWKTNERLFTTNKEEIAYAQKNYVGWMYEGIAFHASTNTSDTPVYRLANWKTNERLFTTNADEIAYAQANYPGWVYEGVAFYAP